ncbi:Uncharacterised protein [Bordetella pertussis]|nr:Uncharacterised protein [Bordetella pertussis]
MPRTLATRYSTPTAMAVEAMNTRAIIIPMRPRRANSAALKKRNSVLTM